MIDPEVVIVGPELDRSRIVHPDGETVASGTLPGTGTYVETLPAPLADFYEVFFLNDCSGSFELATGGSFSLAFQPTDVAHWTDALGNDNDPKAEDGTFRGIFRWQ